MFALVKDVKENLPLDVGTSFSLQTCWHMLACVGIRWQWAWEAWVAFLWTFALRFERLPLGVLLEEPNFLLLSAGVLLNLAQSHCRILRSHRLLIIQRNEPSQQSGRMCQSYSCRRLQGGHCRSRESHFLQMKLSATVERFPRSTLLHLLHPIKVVWYIRRSLLGVDRKFLMCPLRSLRSLSCFKLQGMTSEVYPSSGSSDCLQELRVVTGFTKIRSYKQCHLD